jgi:photosynthetic reaction center cytochrome c subunit
MRAIITTRKALPLAVCGLALVVASGCEGPPPPQSTQVGYRGTGMVEHVNPRILAKQHRENVAPAPLPAAVPVATTAGQVYKNLKVLNDVPITEFTRLMLAISEWVVPRDQWVNGQGCVNCHDLADMAADTKYQKVVARSMLKMTQRINTVWGVHVSPTGVTCYTCHRGNAVPKLVWTTNPGEPHASGQVPALQNRLSQVPAFAALPYDPMTTYFDKDTNILVVPPKPMRPGIAPTVNTKQTEWTYALMMYISRSLGVGCNHCHNSRQFKDWTQSTPFRTKAWYAIRQVREMNRSFIWPLNDILPASRKGPLGDPMRTGCETCHQGVNKPLFGAPMLKDYPVLGQPTQAAPVVAPTPAAPAAVKTGAEVVPASDAKVTGHAGTAEGVM